MAQCTSSLWLRYVYFFHWKSSLGSFFILCFLFSFCLLFSLFILSVNRFQNLVKTTDIQSNIRHCYFYTLLIPNDQCEGDGDFEYRTSFTMKWILNCRMWIRKFNTWTYYITPWNIHWMLKLDTLHRNDKHNEQWKTEWEFIHFIFSSFSILFFRAQFFLLPAKVKASSVYSFCIQVGWCHEYWKNKIEVTLNSIYLL